MSRFLVLIVLFCSSTPETNATQQTLPGAILPTREISIAGQSVLVELAVSAEEKGRGLMHRNSLQDGQGMLFRYDPAVPVSFWMKNVRFALDLLFFNHNGCLLSHYDRVPPCTDSPCPIYSSHHPTRWVLELPAGTRDRLLLLDGDCVPDLRIMAPAPPRKM